MFEGGLKGLRQKMEAGEYEDPDGDRDARATSTGRSDSHPRTLRSPDDPPRARLNVRGFYILERVSKGMSLCEETLLVYV